MGRLPQGRPMSGHQRLHRLTQIFQYVPTVSHMNRLGRAGSTATRIGFPTIAADNLDARMCSEPGGKGFFCALRQQVYGSMLLQIDQDRARALTTAKRPVNHTQDARRGSGWMGMTTEQCQERVRTDRNPPSRTLACTCLTSKRKACFKELST